MDDPQAAKIISIILLRISKEFPRMAVFTFYFDWQDQNKRKSR